MAPVWIVSGLCALLVVFGVLLVQVVLAQSAFKLGHIREQTAVAEARHQELMLEATKLGSPGRIERYARTRLGMVDASDVAYIVADVHEASFQSSIARARRPETLSDPGVAAPVGDLSGSDAP